MNKREDILNKLNKYTGNQKEIAKKIIEKTDNEDLDAVWSLISQRIKTGFVFDEAPEVNNNCVSYLKENKNLSINLDKENTLEHSLIIGENYDALKNLLVAYTDKQGKGLVDIIYIDPPYNTEKSKEEGASYTEDIESKKFIYRDKYTRDGWLNMMNERLKLAKRILKDDGVIFISIDDNEQAYLKVLCDEIFGEENNLGTFIVKSTPNARDYGHVGKMHEYILFYCKDHNNVHTNLMPVVDKKFKYKDSKGGFNIHPLYNSNEAFTNLNRPNLYYPFYLDPDSKKGEFYTISLEKTSDKCIEIYPPKSIKNNVQFVWRWGKDKSEANINKEIVGYCVGKNDFRIVQKMRHDEKLIRSILDSPNYTSRKGTAELEEIMGQKIFSFPKPITLIRDILFMATTKKSTILDFFAGSGTTGQAVMELNEEDGGNRKFILVTNNENNIATTVTRERLFRVINGKGSKGEDFEWSYSKDKKCLNNNSLRVFDITKEELDITDFDKAEKIANIANESFNKLNKDFEKKNINIYNALASLTPYKDKGEN